MPDRGLRRALEEANVNTPVASPAAPPLLPALPARQQCEQQSAASQENRQPLAENVNLRCWKYEQWSQHVSGLSL